MVWGFNLDTYVYLKKEGEKKKEKNIILMNYGILKSHVDPFAVFLLRDVPAFTENGDNMLCLLRTESKFWLPAAIRASR